MSTYDYEVEACNEETYGGNFLCWIYRNAEYNSNCCGDATINIAVYEGDNQLYAGTVDVAAATTDDIYMRKEDYLFL